jgi:ABC-type transport system involved in multi-copper enzyme maturation permease subunit
MSGEAMIQLRGTRTLVAYIMATALRDRLFLALLVLIALATTLAVFIGGTAVVEKRELSVAYVAAATRLIVVAGLVLFVCFQVRRWFDSREIEMMLSRPISRTNFVFAYVISLVILSAIAVMIATVAVGAVARPAPVALAQWALSLLLECTIMVLAALFFALGLASAVASVLVCFGFYVLARMIGILTGIAHATGEGSFFIQAAAWIMEVISVVIPRLDLFGQTDWLVHGVGGEIGLTVILLQTLVYASLLVAAAVFDIQRRQF